MSLGARRGWMWSGRGASFRWSGVRAVDLGSRFWTLPPLLRRGFSRDRTRSFRRPPLHAIPFFISYRPAPARIGLCGLPGTGNLILGRSDGRARSEDLPVGSPPPSRGSFKVGCDQDLRTPGRFRRSRGSFRRSAEGSARAAELSAGAAEPSSEAAEPAAVPRKVPPERRNLESWPRNFPPSTSKLPCAARNLPQDRRRVSPRTPKFPQAE